jgi:hypothetical protein
MKMTILDSMQVSDLQAAFNQAYPFLKIEFYNSPHGWGEACGKAKQYKDVTSLKKILTHKDHPSTIEFLPWQKTGEIETLLKQQFGLFVQVWRKYGECWIETAGTDELSLDEQNDLGRRAVLKDHENLWADRSHLF